MVDLSTNELQALLDTFKSFSLTWDRFSELEEATKEPPKFRGIIHRFFGPELYEAIYEESQENGMGLLVMSQSPWIKAVAEWRLKLTA